MTLGMRTWLFWKEEYCVCVCVYECMCKGVGVKCQLCHGGFMLGL